MMGIGLLLILILSKMIFSIEVIHVKKEYRDFILEKLNLLDEITISFSKEF